MNGERECHCSFFNVSKHCVLLKMSFSRSKTVEKAVFRGLQKMYKHFLTLTDHQLITKRAQIVLFLKTINHCIFALYNITSLFCGSLLFFFLFPRKDPSSSSTSISFSSSSVSSSDSSQKESLFGVPAPLTSVASQNF